MAKHDDIIAYICRHGDTVASERKIFISWTDVALSDEGETQVDAQVKYLSDFDYKRVVSSPLQRCTYAAEQLAGKNFEQDRGLLPWNRGVLTGISEADGEQALELFLDNPQVAIPLGESRMDCERRLRAFFVPALERAEDESTVFFTHHSVIDVLNCMLLGVRTKEPKNLVKPGGIVAVYADGDGYRLEPVLEADGNNQGLS